MDEDTIKVLTLYISVWGWQILSMIFLLGAFLSKSITIAIGFIGVFVMTQLMSWNKRKQFMKYGNE